MSHAAALANEPIDLGHQRHLLIDKFMLAETRGVTFSANPPRLVKTVLTQDRPWESLAEYSSVIDDGTEYKMYYASIGGHGQMVCLATSTDGVNWIKPELGIYEIDGSSKNNVVIRGTAMGSATYDEHDPDPSRRYKYFTCNTSDDKPDTPTAEGMVLYTSPDGVNFKKHDVTLLPFNADSQAILFWDPNVEKYVCYMRGNDGEIPGSRGRKVVRGQTAEPFIPWPYKKVADPFFHGHEFAYVTSELPTVLRTDAQDPDETDLYGSQVFLYPWAHKVYLAFPTVYYHYKEGRLHLDPDKRGANVGAGEVQIAVSRDGIKWKRYRRPAYIKQGWYGNSYCAWPWMLRGMFRRDNKILQYVSLRRAGHGGKEFVESPNHALDGFTLFEQHADRFIAAEFDYTGGVVVSEPLIFEGDSLLLNVDTGATGEARVSLLDENRTPIAGFETENCDVVNGDFTDRKITWAGAGDVSGLAGRPIRLRFEMRGTKLYAFQFTNGGK